MKEFGERSYSDYVYFNFDGEDSPKTIFEANKKTGRIVELLSLISRKKSNQRRR